MFYIYCIKLIFTVILLSGYYYYSQFINEDTGAMKLKTALRPENMQVAEKGLEPKQFESWVLAINFHSMSNLHSRCSTSNAK